MTSRMVHKKQVLVSLMAAALFLAAAGPARSMRDADPPAGSLWRYVGTRVVSRSGRPTRPVPRLERRRLVGADLGPARTARLLVADVDGGRLAQVERQRIAFDRGHVPLDRERSRSRSHCRRRRCRSRRLRTAANEVIERLFLLGAQLSDRRLDVGEILLIADAKRGDELLEFFQLALLANHRQLEFGLILTHLSHLRG